MTSPTPGRSAAPQSSSLAEGFQPGRLIPIITSGLVVAIFEVIVAASMAALVFSGDLAGYVASGIGLALFGGIVTGAAVALLGSLPGTVGGVQDAPAAIMAVIAAAIAASMPSAATGDEIFMTVVAAIAITAMLTGVCLLGLGYFRLGNLVRFLPYPVVGGFLAGTGWLLFSGAMAMISGLTLAPSNLPTLFEPAALLTWLPALIWAIVAFMAMRRFNHPLLLPGLIVIGIILFYGVAWLGNTSVEQLSDQGYLLGPIPDGQMWHLPSVSDLKLVNWPVVLNQALSIATIIILSMVGVLLNASGLEVTFRKDMDLNRELRATGIGNLLAGVGAGFVGFQQLSGSALVFGLKATSRWVGLLAAGICAIFLIFGGSTLSLFPKGVLGGLLLLVGLSFLYEWLVESWTRLPRQDYAIVVIILLTTAVVGFLQAVVLGLLIAIILFVVSYSWSDVVRAEQTGAIYHSRVSRSRRQRQLLDQEGEQLYILQLQGFVFFGTANGINNRILQRHDDPAFPGPRFVILDFKRVTGLDSTASLSFTRLAQSAGARNIRLAISSPSSTIWRQLLQAGLCDPGDGFQVFSTLDKGAEWCENRLLEASETAGQTMDQSLPEQLAEIMGDSAGLTELMNHMEKLEVDAGYRLIAKGDPADTLYVIVSGRVTAQLTQENGESIRLESMGSGHVVGEIGFYLGGQRTADVIADEPSVLYRLSLAELQEMQTSDPDAASALHRLIAILLAERVSHLTTVVEAEDRR